MKGGREHRVPLSSRALAIIEGLAKAKTGAFVFPAQSAGRPLSGAAMEMVLRRALRAKKCENAQIGNPQKYPRRDGSWLPFGLPRLVWEQDAFPA
jgi:integrase